MAYTCALRNALAQYTVPTHRERSIVHVHNCVFSFPSCVYNTRPSPKTTNTRPDWLFSFETWRSGIVWPTPTSTNSSTSSPQRACPDNPMPTWLTQLSTSVYYNNVATYMYMYIFNLFRSIIIIIIYCLYF